MGFDTIWLSKMIDRLKKENKAQQADLKALAVAASEMILKKGSPRGQRLREALARPGVKKILND